MPRSAQCTHVRCILNCWALRCCSVLSSGLPQAHSKSRVSSRVAGTPSAISPTDCPESCGMRERCTDATVRRGFGAYLLVLRVLFGQCVQGTLSTLARGRCDSLIESISWSSLACTAGNLATWYRNHVVVACVVSYAPLSSPITAEIPRACDTTCKVAALQHATCHVAHSLQCCFEAMRLPRYTPAVPATSTSKACLCVQHTQACPFRACGNSRPNSAHLVEEVRAVVRLVGADQCQRVRPV